MGECIICGTSTEGHVCETHQEDVAFEFRGNRPGQLKPGRFYRGTVDGYAEFGVFVDLSDRVTGLLHRSKLDKRLESLDWEVGDDVYVQVTNIRDNGDVDLGWSIRQSERDFRGFLIQDPDGGDQLAEPEDESGNATESAPEPEPEPEPEPAVEVEPERGTKTPTEGVDDEEQEAEAEPEAEPAAEAGGEPETEAEPEPDPEPETEPEPEVETETDSEPESEPEPTADDVASEDVSRVAVDELRERVGEDVRIEGEIVSVRQTSGPTVFELRDETGVVDCAAFVEAGVRAYPEVEVGDIVRLVGEIRVRRDELQVETEALAVLEDEEREEVADRMEEALDAAADPGEIAPIAEDEAVDAVVESAREAGSTIRRAVKESRPIVVRHSADTDGYVAGAAIERAVLPLVREEHAGSDAVYHYFDRRPLEGTVYDLDDATNDVTRMLGDRERHDEKIPLFVFAGAGGTRDSLDGLELLGVYGADRIVVDGTPVEDEVADLAESVVATEETRTAGTVAATLAAGINPEVREDLGHLPAITYWDDVPEAYAEAAEAAGVDEEAATRLREAIALEAYYQSYEDKRELIIDLLFEQQHGLAEQVSTQFRTKLDAEMDTALANLETREAGGVEFTVLDTDSYTHRFDFPPTGLLLDELHRREDSDATVTVGVGRDELVVRAGDDVDLRAVADRVAEAVPEGGVSARGTREGVVEFLAGERDAVVDAVLEEVAAELSAAPAA
jgi:RecJ-like exonuclease